MAELVDYYVRCSHCNAKNRLPAVTLAQNPTCGKCKERLFSATSPVSSGTLIVPCKQCQSHNKVPLEKLTQQPRCGKCKAALCINLVTRERPLIVSDQNFTETVLCSPLPFLVDFHSPNCGPCKMLMPTIIKVARDYQGRLNVGTLDVDVNQYIPSLYRVGSTPTLLLFARGKEFHRLEGYQSSATITRWIRPHAW